MFEISRLTVLKLAIAKASEQGVGWGAGGGGQDPQ